MPVAFQGGHLQTANSALASGNGRVASFDAPWAGVILTLLALGILVAGTALMTRVMPRRRRHQTPPQAIPTDRAEQAAPDRYPTRGAIAGGRPIRLRLGELLQDAGALSERELTHALKEQAQSGGRLGEILVAHGMVPVDTLATVLARELGLETLQPSDEPVPVLAADEARTWRAVPLDGDGRPDGAMPVALADPTEAVLTQLEQRLSRSVVPKLCDERTLDELLNRVYADVDAEEVTRALRDEAPHMSAFRTAPSKAQTLLACVLGFAVTVGLLTDVRLLATVLVGIATAFFLAATGFRLYAAAQGSRRGTTIDPPPEELAAIDERELPVYTILLPLYKEKPTTVRALFDALSQLDYPKQKLDGMLLVEADDDYTRATIEQVGRPPWLRVLPLPPGTPRTKPRAMMIGLRYAKGSLLTVYDAEDKPDPAQLKKAVLGFRRAGDESLACLQAKLGYYNPRQNLLTRWFTLEYDAWFNIFLPGLHRIGAPIPLGGTSNHFRRPALEACLGWDPYNVTEDADLGLRFARLGLRTAMLESTTEEEANSRVPNWLRQRSRWSKGYMQTLLVHTRRPRTLLRELGPKATSAFLLTIGGAVVTALLAPIFWLMLLLWIYAQPDWIAAVFPGLTYYPASLSLVLGNFLLILLSLAAAVSRGHDDLAPHALLIPIYWLMMSAATYVALVELVLRPSHWHKTEHGLHVVEEPT
ncbi:glycosyltransferase family 2 protein [Candidatus Solirubrobacter pratensis]|uniref:glycosyltransferase family 2 protein n=1 Tax=Candidatus Solirubrobacter pratensis TaxID=1298857 RepID=UPI0004060192|nr:glycosyltransferase family 2 protein [Candidatus Solirubrobacter pratensis]